MRAAIRMGIAVAVLAVAGGGAYWYWSSGVGEIASEAAEDTASPPTPVEAVEVEMGAVTEEVTAAGSLRSNESVSVSAEIAGLIAAVHVAEGEAVDEGEPLFELDDSIYRAEVAEAEARLALSEANYQRAIELFDKDVGSARARDEARAELETARAVVGVARARLEKTRIHAPFDGILGFRRVSVGEYVTPGEQLVNLENLRPIKVDFRVAERYLQQLRPGQVVEFSVQSLPGQSFEGEVTAIDPEVDPETRSVAVRAQAPNEDRLLRPGQFARVNLVVARRENAVLVPEQALMPRAGDNFVFKVVDGKAVLTGVEVGGRRRGEAEVVSGLEAGDVVVTGGHQKIRDGAAVQPVAADEIS